MIAVKRQTDVDAAIRRSRTARKAQRNHRRRSFAIAAGLSLALSGAAIVSLDSLTGAAMVHAAVSSAQSLGDLIGQRSPGQRVQAQLTKARHARAIARVLPRARSHAPPPPPSQLAKLLMGPPAEIPVELAPPAPIMALNGQTPVVLTSSPGGGGGAIVSPPGGGGGISPPGGGGTIVSSPRQPDTFPSEPRQPLSSAVPEPSAWVLMLMGFALIGWRARPLRLAPLN